MVILQMPFGSLESLTELLIHREVTCNVLLSIRCLTSQWQNPHHFNNSNGFSVNIFLLKLLKVYTSKQLLKRFFILVKLYLSPVLINYAVPTYVFKVLLNFLWIVPVPPFVLLIVFHYRFQPSRFHQTAVRLNQPWLSEFIAEQRESVGASHSKQMTSEVPFKLLPWNFAVSGTLRDRKRLIRFWDLISLCKTLLKFTDTRRSCYVFAICSGTQEHDGFLRWFQKLSFCEPRQSSSQRCGKVFLERLLYNILDWWVPLTSFRGSRQCA